MATGIAAKLHEARCIRLVDEIKRYCLKFGRSEFTMRSFEGYIRDKGALTDFDSRMIEIILNDLLYGQQPPLSILMPTEASLRDLTILLIANAREGGTTDPVFQSLLFIEHVAQRIIQLTPDTGSSTAMKIKDLRRLLEDEDSDFDPETLEFVILLLQKDGRVSVSGVDPLFDDKYVVACMVTPASPETIKNSLQAARFKYNRQHSTPNFFN